MSGGPFLRFIFWIYGFNVGMGAAQAIEGRGFGALAWISLIATAAIVVFAYVLDRKLERNRAR